MLIHKRLHLNQMPLEEKAIRSFLYLLLSILRKHNNKSGGLYFVIAFT